MGRRRQFSVEDLPLVGGALILDFVNTTGARVSKTPRERLDSFADLLTWSVKAGIIDVPLAAQYRSSSLRAPDEADRAFQGALRFRETAYLVLASLATGRSIPSAHLAEFEGWLHRGCGERLLQNHDGTLDWNWHLRADRLESLLWPMVGSADSLIASGLAKLRKCGECDWLFLDTSKNNSRQWCKKLCGDRVRSKRYYSRISKSSVPR